MGRSTMGVTIMKLSEEDKVIAVARLVGARRSDGGADRVGCQGRRPPATGRQGQRRHRGVKPLPASGLVKLLLSISSSERFIIAHEY